MITLREMIVQECGEGCDLFRATAEFQMGNEQYEICPTCGEEGECQALEGEE